MKWIKISISSSRYVLLFLILFFSSLGMARAQGWIQINGHWSPMCLPGSPAIPPMPLDSVLDTPPWGCMPNNPDGYWTIPLNGSYNTTPLEQLDKADGVLINFQYLSLGSSCAAKASILLEYEQGPNLQRETIILNMNATSLISRQGMEFNEDGKKYTKIQIFFRNLCGQQVAVSNVEIFTYRKDATPTPTLTPPPPTPTDYIPPTPTEAPCVDDVPQQINTFLIGSASCTPYPNHCALWGEPEAVLGPPDGSDMSLISDNNNNSGHLWVYYDNDLPHEADVQIGLHGWNDHGCAFIWHNADINEIHIACYGSGNRWVTIDAIEVQYYINGCDTPPTPLPTPDVNLTASPTLTYTLPPTLWPTETGTPPPPTETKTSAEETATKEATDAPPDFDYPTPSNDATATSQAGDNNATATSQAGDNNATATSQAGGGDGENNNATATSQAGDNNATATSQTGDNNATSQAENNTTATSQAGENNTTATSQAEDNNTTATRQAGDNNATATRQAGDNNATATSQAGGGGGGVENENATATAQAGDNNATSQAGGGGDGNRPDAAATAISNVATAAAGDNLTATAIKATEIAQPNAPIGPNPSPRAMPTMPTSFVRTTGYTTNLVIVPKDSTCYLFIRPLPPMNEFLGVSLAEWGYPTGSVYGGLTICVLFWEVQIWLLGSNLWNMLYYFVVMVSFGGAIRFFLWTMD